MRILDLFCGLKGWSQPFEDRGHEVFTLDFNPDFAPDICSDILTVMAQDLPLVDVICASPPCEKFSMANKPHQWWYPEDKSPRNLEAQMALDIVTKTVSIIQTLKPQFFVIENPRGLLRKMNIIPYELRTVTYCQYGLTRMKPTDLWGGFPPSLELHAMCKNGDPCHVRAPRGSSTGTQGMKSAAEKSKIPYQLALDICISCENDLK